MAKFYDRTGAAYSLDHEHDGKAYVRPMVKVIVQSSYGDDFHEETDHEPADYLVEMRRSDLFDAPPIVALNEEIAAKKAELAALSAQAKKVVDDARSKKFAAENELASAKRQLEQWMQTHKSMIDLGKLLDGKVLYPLSVEEDRYRGGWVVPQIPKMKDISGLRVECGDFEKGKEWRVKRYLSDHYHTSFQFFDTEEDRAAVILAQFETTCEMFRKRPDFGERSYSSDLDYGTLCKWVATHPALKIPVDIQATKTAHEAQLVEKRKAALAAELAAIEATS